MVKSSWMSKEFRYDNSWHDGVRAPALPSLVVWLNELQGNYDVVDIISIDVGNGLVLVLVKVISER